MRQVLSNIFDAGIDNIPKLHQSEFWDEILTTNVRRIRSLLLLAVPGLCVLLYGVQIRNIFGMSAEFRSMILTMQVLILAVLLVFAGFLFARPLSNIHSDSRYFLRLLQSFTLIVVLLTQIFFYILLTTGGHPVFFYQVLIAWAAALLLLPRTALLLGCVMYGGFALTLIRFALANEEMRLLIESLASSAAITSISLVSSMMLFRNAVNEFCRRLALEEERNKVIMLNAELHTAYIETDTINQELKKRQEILEEQATEIEIINTQLQENNEQLFVLNTEKNEILAMVAHDLKNPIAALGGLSEILLHESNNIDEAYQRTILKQFVVTTARMGDLVKNLLDINQLESGGRQFLQTEVDIKQQVEYAIAVYGNDAEKKDITIHFQQTTAQAPLFVLADEQALMQILDNLVSNAVKYSPHERNIFVRLESSNGIVRLEIEDEGPGISEDDMKKLFGKFTRLSARPTGGEHSTGLGLSIVKKMVEAMNGKVWCESELGKGATFIVELPRN